MLDKNPWLRRSLPPVPVLILTWLFSGGCSRVHSGGGWNADADTGSAPSLGDVMVQVGRRFEIAGRAAAAGRFELAAFEAGELGELFEDAVPRATLPKEGPTAHIRPMAAAFRSTAPEELRKAAVTSDARAFAQAFQHTASLCNACHQASAKGFIQVPSVPGRSVPDLEPLAPPVLSR